MGRIYYLQTSHDGYWKKLGDDMSLSKMKIEAERGNIYTHDGRILATTIPTFELRMDTKADGLTDTIWNRHIDSLCMLLASYIPEKSDSGWRHFLVSARKNNIRHLLLSENISFQEFKKIRQIPLFKLGKNKSGFIHVQSNTRKMPFGELACRSIGYANTNNKIGIEGRYNEELAGENKEVLMQKVAGGVYMPVNDDSDFGSKPGLDIYTTLDINLQDITEQSLLKSVSNFKADHGSAILMNVKTGEIKAIANIGRKKNGTYGEIFNYAINELNEPGSVMKLASVMALIDEGYCDENSIIDLGNGEYKMYDYVMKDDHKLEGKITLTKAFEVSSNVGISKPVFKYFNNKKSEYYDKLEQFHLTKPLDIGLNGVSSPEIKPHKEWTGLTLPMVSIGYELRLTPLQVLGLYAAVANNGKMMKPYLVKEIRDNDKILEKFEPIVLENQIAKPSTIQAVRRMLERVVDSGTATSIKNKNYKIAGKTGTNRLTESKKGYKLEQYQASFAGYFPAKNPVYACIVVVNKPDKNIGYYGRDVAAPVFKDIADRLYSTDKEIHPPLTAITGIGLMPFIGLKNEIERISTYFNWNLIPTNSNSEFVTAVIANKNIVLKPSFITSQKSMPNLVNMNLKDAVFILESMGAKVLIEGRGKVKDQSVAAGEKIFKGTNVKLILG